MCSSLHALLEMRHTWTWGVRYTIWSLRALPRERVLNTAMSIFRWLPLAADSFRVTGITSCFLIPIGLTVVLPTTYVTAPVSGMVAICVVSHIVADWFVAAASRAQCPLRHNMAPSVILG